MLKMVCTVTPKRSASCVVSSLKGTTIIVFIGWSRSPSLGGALYRNDAITPSRKTTVLCVRCTVSQKVSVRNPAVMAIEAPRHSIE